MARRLLSMVVQLEDRRSGDYHAACEVTTLSAAAQAQVRKVAGQHDDRMGVQHIGYGLRTGRLRCRQYQTGGGCARGFTTLCMV